MALYSLEEVPLDPAPVETFMAGCFPAQHAYESPPLFLLFQVARNKMKDDVKKAGLDKVDKLVPAGFVQVLIVITPAGSEAEVVVPREYLNSDEFPGSRGADRAFLVYHLPMNDDVLFSS